MTDRRMFGLLGVLALLAGCAGGGEQQRETFTLSVKVTHKKYDPIHTRVTRDVKPDDVKKRVLMLAGLNQVEREEALADLVAMGREQPRSTALIIGFLNHPEPAAREYSLLALAKIGPGGWSVPVDKFRTLINDSDERVVCACLFACATLGVKDRDIAKRAFEYLADPRVSVRTYAAECIRKLAYWPAIPALIYGQLGRSNVSITLRVYAWEALQNITLERVEDFPKGPDMFSILDARAKAWTQWWEANRYKYGG